MRVVIEVIVAGLLTGWAIAVPIGAVGAFLVTLTARTSYRVGACAALGVATVDGGYAALATIAGGFLSALLRPIADPLQIVAALVLLVVAVLIAVQTMRPSDAEAGQARSMRGRSAFALFVAITAVNPATVVYFTAIVLGNRHLTSGPAEGTTFVVAVFCASASWCLSLAGAGALLGRAVTGPRGRVITGLVSAVVIAGLAVRTAVG